MIVKMASAVASYGAMEITDDRIHAVDIKKLFLYIVTRHTVTMSTGESECVLSYDQGQ